MSCICPQGFHYHMEDCSESGVRVQYVAINVPFVTDKGRPAEALGRYSDDSIHAYILGGKEPYSVTYQGAAFRDGEPFDLDAAVDEAIEANLKPNPRRP